jgi:hypothetical protein
MVELQPVIITLVSVKSKSAFYGECPKEWAKIGA